MPGAESEVSKAKLLVESGEVIPWCGCMMIRREFSQLEKWPHGSYLELHEVGMIDRLGTRLISASRSTETL